MTFLGHMVSDQGVEVDSIKNWPRPLTPTDVQSFLGSADFYRRVFRDFPILLLD